jgi:hypothetical protein
MMEESYGVREEVVRLLDILDKFVRRDETPSQVVSYGLLLWPWARQVIKEKGHLYGDKVKLLADEFAGARVLVIIPKTLRANVIHALEILERMILAMQTGRMRWSLVKRASYKDASTLFALITLGRLVHDEDAFAAAFSEKFPLSKGIGRFQKKRRRRYRKPKSSTAIEQRVVFFHQ